MAQISTTRGASNFVIPYTGIRSVSNWTSYTPQTDGFGTISASGFRYRRVGDSCEIQGKFIVGTPTAVEAKIYLPVVEAVQLTSSIPITSQIVGSGARDTVGAVDFHVLCGVSGTSWLAFGRTTPAEGGFSRLTGSVLFDSGQTFSFFATVSIDQWANYDESVDASIYVEPASATQSGIVTTGAQTIAGAKTLTGNTSLDGGSFVFNESGADKDFRIEGDNNANLLFCDASTDRIGIGTSTPGSLLHVFRAAGLSGLIVGSGNAGGAGLYLDGSANGDAVGSDYSTIAHAADKSLTIENYADPAIFIRNTSGRAIELGANTFYSSFIRDNTTASASNVFIDATSGLLQRSTSSLRYKTDIRSYDKGLEDVLKLKPVYFKGSNSDKQHAGLIAEDVHAVGLSEFVEYDNDNRPDSLGYAHMVSLLTKAIQEQQAIIEELKARIEALEA